MIIKENINLNEYSYMKTGGIGKNIFYPETAQELSDLISKNSDMIVIGNGSNILFGDGFIDKDFLSLKEFNKIAKLEEGLIQVDAGVRTSELIKFLKENNLNGYEELTGIPGTIGGMTIMNAGAYGKEIFSFIESVEIVNKEGKYKKLQKEEIKYGYRWTELKNHQDIVLSVVLRFGKGFDSSKVQKLLSTRKEKQPLEFPNLGSIFKNPEGDFAARLIEECGLKGMTIGGAKVSEKHANFIVNYSCATSENVLNLIELIKDKVYEKSGIKLEEEIIIIK